MLVWNVLCANHASVLPVTGQYVIADRHCPAQPLTSHNLGKMSALSCNPAPRSRANLSLSIKQVRPDIAGVGCISRVKHRCLFSDLCTIQPCDMRGLGTKASTRIGYRRQPRAHVIPPLFWNGNSLRATRPAITRYMRISNLQNTDKSPEAASESSF